MTDATIMNSQIATLHRRLRRDAEHDLAVVVLWASEGQGTSFAVADAATGEIIAWDGFYFGEEPVAEPCPSFPWTGRTGTTCRRTRP